MIPFTPSNPGNRRRSQRVLLQVRVRIGAVGSLGKNLYESTETLTVNAHGALILLEARLIIGDKVQLQHNLTQEEQECVVMFVGPTRGIKQEIGLEFTSPRQGFWRVAFPPDDWTSKDTDARAIASGRIAK